MQIDIIRDIKHLEALRNEWNQAVKNSSFDSVFVTHELFYSWAKNFVTEDNLHIIIARDGNELAGIMPLLIERQKKYFMPETILKSMSNLQTYKYDFIINKNNSEKILSAMIDFINKRTSWTSIILEYVPEKSNILYLLESTIGGLRYKIRKDFHMASPYVQISGTWDEYLATRDKKVRKNLEYFERKLEKEGTPELVSVTDGDDLAQHIQGALEIEKSSWKGDIGTAIANSQAEAGFYQDLARSMSKIGKFGLHFLNFNGQKIAFDFCLTHNDHFNVLKTGYDPTYSKSSPGRVLRKKMLRSLFEDKNYKIYDLLGANEAWKREWTETTQTLLKVEIYSHRPIAIINYTIKSMQEKIKEILLKNPRLFLAIKKLYLRIREK